MGGGCVTGEKVKTEKIPFCCLLFKEFKPLRADAAVDIKQRQEAFAAV